jgi:hypothetical protein
VPEIQISQGEKQSETTRGSLKNNRRTKNGTLREEVITSQKSSPGTNGTESQNEPTGT